MLLNKKYVVTSIYTYSIFLEKENRKIQLAKV